MARRVVITQDDDGTGGWAFVGEVWDVAGDGTKELVTSANSAIGGATGISPWQIFINGASFVLDQMSDSLS